MKAPILFLALFTLATNGLCIAQIQNLNPDQIKDKDSETVLRLTTEMFSDQIPMPVFTSETPSSFHLLESGISHSLIYLGANILLSKLNLDSGLSSFSAYPKTVTEYNNSVRRQMFDAEPTSQQRRSSIIIRNH
jgi:hypothetical protein